MSFPLDRPAQPEQRVVHRLGSWKRVKRVKDRRVFRVLSEDRRALVLVPLLGGRERTLTPERVERDFVPVARCPVCGWHHDTRKATRHAA